MLGSRNWVRNWDWWNITVITVILFAGGFRYISVSFILEDESAKPWRRTVKGVFVIVCSRDCLRILLAFLCLHYAGKEQFLVNQWKKSKVLYVGSDKIPRWHDFEKNTQTSQVAILCRPMGNIMGKGGEWRDEREASGGLNRENGLSCL